MSGARKAFVYDSPLSEQLHETAESAPAEEADESPIEDHGDDDFDEWRAPEYLRELYGVPMSRFRKPKAHLAIMESGGGFVAAVMGLGKQRRPGPGFPLWQKVLLLKKIGNKIAEDSALMQDTAQGGAGGLVQSDLAAALEAETKVTKKTWAPRISKLVNMEHVELPDGRVVPLAHFFRKSAGRRADPKHLALVEYLCRTGVRKNTDLARGYLESVGAPPSQSVDSDAKQFERLVKELRALRAATTDLGLVFAAQKYLTDKAHPLSDAKKLAPSIALFLKNLKGAS